MFRNREDAGRQLAKVLIHYTNQRNTAILALPRGGVPVAHEVALKLNLPLDIFLVHKIGVPGNEEVAMGAIATPGIQALDKALIQYLNISSEKVNEAIAKAQEELRYRNNLYHVNRPMIDIQGHNVIIIDDGMATGATMQVAIKALHQQKVNEIIVAVPVSSEEAYNKIQKIANRVISLHTPKIFDAVGSWYVDFTQVSHEQVKNLLSDTKFRF
jgi:putative phosphoribosyl transferase